MGEERGEKRFFKSLNQEEKDFQARAELFQRTSHQYFYLMNGYDHPVLKIVSDPVKGFLANVTGS